MLNQQIPKYDLVVAANTAYQAGVARRASVLNSAVDWPLVLSNLFLITPAGAEVQDLSGTSVAPAGTAGAAGAATTAGSATTAATTTPSTSTSAAIGTIQFGVTGPGPSLSISESWINAVAGSKYFANPIQGSTVASGQQHLISVLDLGDSRSQPFQECEPAMNTVREYRMPLMIGAGALIVALLLWAVFVSPESSKLSSLKSQDSSLQQQETALDVKLAALKSEKQSLTKSCADLEKIATQIPSVETPTDVDAEESSFENQFNALAAVTGVTLTQFNGFVPATATAAYTWRFRNRNAGGRRGGANQTVSHRQLQPDGRLHRRTGQLPPPLHHPDHQLRLGTSASSASSTSSSSSTGRGHGDGGTNRGAFVDRWPAGGTDRGTLQPVGGGFDLLHHLTQCPCCLHQSHSQPPLVRGSRR